MSSGPGQLHIFGRARAGRLLAFHLDPQRSPARGLLLPAYVLEAGPARRSVLQHISAQGSSITAITSEVVQPCECCDGSEDKFELTMWDSVTGQRSSYRSTRADLLAHCDGQTFDIS